MSSSDTALDPRESLQGEEVQIETGSYSVDGAAEEFVEEYVQEEAEAEAETGAEAEVDVGGESEGVEEGMGEVELGEGEGEGEGEDESEVSLTDSELALLDKDPTEDLELADEEYVDNSRLTFDPEASMGTLLGFPQDQVNEVLETEVAGVEGDDESDEEMKSQGHDPLPASGEPEEALPQEASSDAPNRQRADTFDLMLESGYAFSETDVDAILNDSPSKADPAPATLTPTPQPELTEPLTPTATPPPSTTEPASATTVSETGEGLYYNTNPDGTISLPTFTPEPDTPAETATTVEDSPVEAEPLPFLPGEDSTQRETLNYGASGGDGIRAAESGNTDDGAGVGASSTVNVGGSGGGGEEFGSSDSPDTPLLSSTQEYAGGDLFQDNPPARKMSNRSRMEVMGGDVGTGVGGGSSVSSRSDAEYYNMSDVSPPQMELKDDAWYDRKYIKFIAIGLALLFIILFVVFIAVARGRGGFIAVSIICLVLALPFVGFAVYMFAVRRQ